jgi:UDP-glucose 4-epimerase
MRKYQVSKIIFSSSCAVYGKPKIIPIPEDHPKNPISPYGMSKLMIETILEDCHTAYGMHYINLRYFNAAGILPDSGLGEYHQPETHLIPLLFKAAYEQKPFFLYGTEHPTPDGSCIRDFLHVWDIAHAHAKAVNYLNTYQQSDSFNIGTGQGVSVKEIIKKIEKITQKTIPITIACPRPGDPAILIAESTKAKAIGWHPHYSAIDYILQTALTQFLPPKTTPDYREKEA